MYRIFVSQAIAILFLAGCILPDYPFSPELPSDLPQIPGLPSELSDLPEILGDLGLPDLSEIVGLPDEDSLPSMEHRPGGIVFRGPSEKRINIGARIPGTDMTLLHIGEDGAEFEIDGMRSVRTIGDSLDFDGPWPGIEGVDYSLRLRIYRISGDYVRAAGVHQLGILDVQPVQVSVDLREPVLKFAFSSGVKTNENIAGITYGYGGQDDRGGRLSGLDEGEYPYRKIGDSIRWEGQLRPDIPAQYNVRMLYYGPESARVGGVVKLSLPKQ
jgi:hypothetical protein